MTLAEMASIFAEHILAEGICPDKNVSDRQKLQMLDSDLCGAAVLILDITTRFEFEKAFHEETPRRGSPGVAAQSAHGGEAAAHFWRRAF